MQNIRSKDTVPERIIMKELKVRKIYFAKHVRSIVGTPDIVFRRKKVVVFIDSDFWHGHPTRFIMPASNYEYWSSKISRNVSRDKKVTKELRSQGWKVVRIWEYDVRRDTKNSIRKILKAIDKELTI